MDILNEKIEGLVKKSEKSKMPYGILKKVYDRGMAAWKTGHRPGTTPQQWAFARVNSFITKSSGTWGKADADLAKQVRGEEVQEKRITASKIIGQVKEKLPKDADAGDYVKDFKKSDAPQFKGKSDKKKEKMAVAAYLDSKEEVELEEGGVPARFGLSNSEKMKLAKDFDKLASDRTTSPNEKIYYKNTAKYFMDNMPDKAFNDMMGGAPEHIGGTIGRRTSAIIGKDKAKKVTGYKEEFKEENCPKCDDDPCKCENIQESGHTDVASMKTQVQIAKDALEKMNMELGKLGDEEDLPTWWTNKVATAVGKLDGMADYINAKSQQGDNMNEAPRQLKDPKKETMVMKVKDAGSIMVIDKKDLQKYTSKGYIQVESNNRNSLTASDKSKLAKHFDKLAKDYSLSPENQDAYKAVSDYIKMKTKRVDFDDVMKKTSAMHKQDIEIEMSRIIGKSKTKKVIESNLQEKEIRHDGKGPIKMSKKEYDKINKFRKGDIRGKPHVMATIKKGGFDYNMLVPVIFEEVDLDEGKFTLPMRYVVVDKKTGKVTSASSDDKDFKQDYGRKPQFKIVKLKKPVSQKKTGYLLGEPLKAWGEEVDDITEETVFVIRFEKEGMRFATPFRRMQDAKDGEKILKKSAGVSNVSITKDILKPGIKFSEGVIMKEENLMELKYGEITIDTRNSNISKQILHYLRYDIMHDRDPKLPYIDGQSLDVDYEHETDRQFRITPDMDDRDIKKVAAHLKKKYGSSIKLRLEGVEQEEWMLDDNSIMSRATRLISQTAIREKLDPADVDMKATDLDRKAADKNIFIQLKRAQDMKGKTDVEFLDKKKQKVDIRVINKALDMFDKMKPNDKLKMQTAIGKSYRDLLKVVQRGKV